MKNELGIFRLVGSRQAFRPSRTAALLAAHDLYTKGEQLTAILNVGRDERMDANAIVAAWRELGLF